MTKKWIPLHLHSTNSLLDGLSKNNEIAERCKELEYNACALTDHNTLGGSISHFKECKKRGIKPILGSELYICPNLNLKERSFSHLCILAKNLQGWKTLIKINNESNKNFYYKPRLDLLRLGELLDGNIIGFSGHAGSCLFNSLFIDLKSIYNCTTIDECRQYLDPHWHEKAVALCLQFQIYFGAENFYIEIQLIDRDRLPVAQFAADILREIAKELKIKCIGTADSHYLRKEDALIQRILLCSSLRTNFKEINRKLQNEEEIGLGGFFKSNNYHLPSPDEIFPLHTEEEIENTLKIASECGDYDILSKPLLPSFPTPNSIEESEYLKQLCREGWKSLISNNIDKERQNVYKDRVLHELNVINNAGLSGYFLIVQDYIKAARSRGELASGNRGSAAGSLISYLIGITTIDPIKYDLLFERFYNEGRNTPGNIKMPDIDCDFQKYERENTIEYLKTTYGKENVAHVAAFGRLMGRGALKEVLRAFADTSFDEMNRITEYIPDESKISDDLQQMKEEDGDSSIIKWALENNAKELSEWCQLNDDGTLNGPLADKFELAIKLEGTKKSQGIHASAILVAPHSLEENCPMVKSSSLDELVVGVDHKNSEDLGYCKFDILGITLLDKLHKVKDLLKTRKKKGLDDKEQSSLP